MKVIALAFSGLILAAPAETPPDQYDSTAPITVQVTFADPLWVNAECIKRVGRDPEPGMVFEGCAGVGRKWIIKRHGVFYPGERSAYVDPLLFMGLIGASIAEGKSDIWYADGEPKTEADLMRVPWARKHIRREYREREAWRAGRHHG